MNCDMVNSEMRRHSVARRVSVLAVSIGVRLGLDIADEIWQPSPLQAEPCLSPCAIRSAEKRRNRYNRAERQWPHFDPSAGFFGSLRDARVIKLLGMYCKIDRRGCTLILECFLRRTRGFDL